MIWYTVIKKCLVLNEWINGIDVGLYAILTIGNSVWIKCFLNGNICCWKAGFSSLKGIFFSRKIYMLGPLSEYDFIQSYYVHNYICKCIQ